MNKLLFFCLISLTTAIHVCDLEPTIETIKYQTRWGAPSTDPKKPSTASCQTGETLVSCGIDGVQDIQGTYIDPNDPKTCYASTSNTNYQVSAIAICGKFPPGSIKTTKTITSVDQSNNQVVTKCPSGLTLTGCQVDYQSGKINNIRGSYPGPQQAKNTKPAQNGKAGGIGTENQCIAEALTSTTKI